MFLFFYWRLAGKVAATVTERYSWAPIALSLLKWRLNGLPSVPVSEGIRAGVLGCWRFRLHFLACRVGRLWRGPGDRRSGEPQLVWNLYKIWIAGVGIACCIQELLRFNRSNSSADPVVLNCLWGMTWEGSNLLLVRWLFALEKVEELYRLL